MQVAVRSYLTAGVATVGAGVIALSPIAPPMPTVHLPSVHQAEVQLSAEVGPIEAWVQVIQTAIANLNDLGQQVAADPAPILQQVIANQSADIGLLGNAVQESITGFTNSLKGLPATLQAAAKQVAAGQIVVATNTLLAPVLSDLTATLIDPLIDGFPAFTNPMQNLTNFVAEIPAAIATLGIPLLNPVYSVLNAAAAIAQTIIDSDPAVALNAMINAPATLTGALLNGFGDGPVGLPAGGLLTAFEGGLGSFTAGPIGALIAIRDAFAKAITPAKQQTALKAAVTPAAAASLPRGGTTVTLSTRTASTATAAAKVAQTGAATDSSATGAAATTPATDKHHAQSSGASGKNGSNASAGKTQHRTTGHSASGK